MSQLFHLEFRTPDGNRYILHAPKKKSVWNIEGLGLPPHEIATTQTPFQHGSTPLSYRLQERELTLILRHNGCTYDEKWEHRGSFVDTFRMNRSEADNVVPGTLYYSYYTNGTTITRCLDCILQLNKSLFTNLPGWQDYSFQETLTFLAYNPIWYDPTLISSTQTPSDETLELAVTFPFTLGTYTLTYTITYTGTWETSPIIILTGPMRYVTLIHRETEKRINFDYIIDVGEIVTINLTDPTNITIENNHCDNLIGNMRNSDLTEFRFLPDPLVEDGINHIDVYITNYTTGSSVKFQYYRHYVGF